MHVVAGASVATGHRQVIVHMRHTWTESCGTRSNCGWPTCRNLCSCCGLESVRGQVRMPSFWMRRRLPIGSKSTARLDNKGCVCGVVVVEHFRFELRICRFNHYPSMSFSHWVVVVRFDSSDEVVWSPSAPQVGIFYRRCIRCCCFLSFCFVHFEQSCVCVVVVEHVRVRLFRGLLRCFLCAFVLGLFRTD